MSWIFVLSVGLVGGTLGGVVGFGTSILLLPPLVIVFGPYEAVPIMAVTALLANVSRVMVWWREIDWKAGAVYSVTAAPAAALGAKTLLALPPRVIEIALGAFFLAMIPIRRALLRAEFKIKLWHLAVVGAGIGYLTGIVASTGPINTPFFLAYGLVKGPYLSTEALGSIAVFLSKALMFFSLGALPWATLVKGLIVGSSVMLGSYLGKRIVQRLEIAQFRLLMDAVLLIAGVTMLATASDLSNFP